MGTYANPDPIESSNIVQDWSKEMLQMSNTLSESITKYSELKASQVKKSLEDLNKEYSEIKARGTSASNAASETAGKMNTTNQSIKDEMKNSLVDRWKASERMKRAKNTEEYDKARREFDELTEFTTTAPLVLEKMNELMKNGAAGLKAILASGSLTENGLDTNDPSTRTLLKAVLAEAEGNYGIARRVGKKLMIEYNNVPYDFSDVTKMLNIPPQRATYLNNMEKTGFVKDGKLTDAAFVTNTKTKEFEYGPWQTLKDGSRVRYPKLVDDFASAAANMTIVADTYNQREQASFLNNLAGVYTHGSTINVSPTQLEALNKLNLGGIVTKENGNNVIKVNEKTNEAFNQAKLYETGETGSLSVVYGLFAANSDTNIMKNLVDAKQKEYAQVIKPEKPEKPDEMTKSEAQLAEFDSRLDEMVARKQTFAITPDGKYRIAKVKGKKNEYVLHKMNTTSGVWDEYGTGTLSEMKQYAGY